VQQRWLVGKTKAAVVVVVGRIKRELEPTLVPTFVTLHLPPPPPQLGGVVVAQLVLVVDQPLQAQQLWKTAE
jgi:hypothetical protein